MNPDPEQNVSDRDTWESVLIAAVVFGALACWVWCGRMKDKLWRLLHG